MATKAEFHRGGLLALSAAVLVVTFATGYALGHGGPASATTPHGCNWSTFPPYPNATAVPRPTGSGVAYRIYASVSQVARFYQLGAGQNAWTFAPTPQSKLPWVFRFSSGSGCHGILTVQSDLTGTTVVEANPDSTS